VFRIKICANIKFAEKHKNFKRDFINGVIKISTANSPRSLEDTK
jgi:hypothetical protein